MPTKTFTAFGLLITALTFTSCSSTGVETAKDEGFRPLFNGKDLSGWYIISGKGKKNEDPDRLVQVHNGVIHMYKDAEEGSKQPFGYIVTEEEFSDYHLRFQYKWGNKKFIPKLDAKKDAGLLYHVIGPDGVWPKSVECQIQEGDTGDIFTVFTRVTTTADPSTTNGVTKVMTNSAGVVLTNFTSQPRFLSAAKGGVEVVQGTWGGIRRVVRSEDYEVDGWNTVEVIVRGATSVHIINGKTNNATSNMEHMVNREWVPLTKGKILLQKEGAEVFYRNIELKSLVPH
jgi:hypothetical protein